MEKINLLNEKNKIVMDQKEEIEKLLDEIKENNGEISRLKNHSEMLQNMRKNNIQTINKLRDELRKQKDEVEIWKIKDQKEERVEHAPSYENHNRSSKHFCFNHDSKL